MKWFIKKGRKNKSPAGFLSLRWKLSLPLVLSIALIAASFSPIINQLVNKRIEQEADRQLGDITNSVDILIEDSKYQAVNLASLIASQPEIFECFDNPDEKPSEYILDLKSKLNLQEISLYSNEFIIGDKALFYGGPIISRRFQVSDAVNEVRDALVQKALRERQPASGIAISPQGSQIIGVAPIIEPETKELLGAILVAIFMDKTYITHISHVVGSDVAIVKNNAIIVSTIDMQSNYQILINNGWLETETPTSTIQYTDGSQHRIFAQSFSPDATEQGYILVTKPIGELFSISNNIQKLLWTVVLVFSLSTLIVWLAALFNFAKPLLDLTEATSLIEKGELAQNVKVSYWGFKDEITTLSEHFNSMSRELSGVYNSLEERVEQRTNDLMLEIAERKHAQEALRISEERFALAVQGANDGLWDWNLETNEIYFSPRWKSMLGFEEDQIPDRIEEWLNRIHEEDKDQVQQNINEKLEGSSSNFQFEYRMRSSGGEYLWILCRGIAVKNEYGKVYRLTGSHTDIHSRKEAEKALAYNALHDALTGLPNRVLLTDRISQAIAHIKRNPEKGLALIFIDLDRFKYVNDSLGHATGDKLLIEVAKTLQKCTRENDTVSRLSGDEFCILTDDWRDTNDVLHMAQRIHENLMQTSLPNFISRPASASIGIAIYNQSYNTPDDLIRDADIAMYRSKSLGGGQYQVFDKFMHHHLMEQIQIEDELRFAIENNELVIHYQPVIEAGTKNIEGLEALVRWRHPKRGLLLPKDFLEVAEETGLIKAIDEFIMSGVCEQLKEWELTGLSNFWVSINISDRQFNDGNFISFIKNALKEHSIEAEKIRIEITENIAMKNPDFSSGIFNQLNQLGLRIGIDDFGIGYSSFGHLKKLSFSMLKIDRSFIQDIQSNKNGETITNAIIAMSHSLNMKVVAEGITSTEQASMLKTLGCDYLQGFYFSPGVDAHKMTEILSLKNTLGE